jgi:uncharacterized membrane protein YsdA (DUF1294 family)
VEVLVTALYAVAILTLLNVWTFLLFWFDKFQAKRAGWRIRESTLISLAFLGGGIGAKLGQRVWLHKTYKQPFGRNLNSAIFISVALPTLVGGLFASGGSVDDVLSFLIGEHGAKESKFPRRFGPGSRSDF